ncbi:hypothetical protein BD1_24 [Octadecabacter Antarctic BD virus 1]|nr:hypothetical protein BD1_24 [Octadecabacter Antarctic BD virus 1]
MTRLKQYRRNRRSDVWVLLALFVLLLADPAWIHSLGDASPDPTASFNIGDD